MKTFFRLSAATTCISLVLFSATAAAPPEFRWEEKEIDRIEIGYGLQLTDVNGDGRTDIVLADKSTVQWYENPTWAKHVIARGLTQRDNVCVTARDIDGDGKCEIVVGGQWNFRETVKDGAVHYLVAGTDRTEPWTPVKLYHEPSTHRMHWLKGVNGQYQLVVKPLRGRGNVNDEGFGLMVLAYSRPDHPTQDWPIEVVSNFLHQSHNFHPVNWDDDPEEELVMAAKEGVWHFDRQRGRWRSKQLTNHFAGEIRDGRLPDGRRFIVTIEPMHGTTSAVYAAPEQGQGLWDRLAVLDDALRDGHALAVADYLGVGSDQVVVGWRAMHPAGAPGIKLFTPLDAAGTRWRETKVSGTELAVEDIKAADLDGDGRPEIVAAARQTKNLKIFFNRT